MFIASGGFLGSLRVLLFKDILLNVRDSGLLPCSDMADGKSTMDTRTSRREFLRRSTVFPFEPETGFDPDTGPS